jgi:hypothetical protein
MLSPSSSHAMSLVRMRIVIRHRWIEWPWCRQSVSRLFETGCKLCSRIARRVIGSQESDGLSVELVKGGDRLKSLSTDMRTDLLIVLNDPGRFMRDCFTSPNKSFAPLIFLLGNSYRGMVVFTQEVVLTGYLLLSNVRP